MGNINVRAAAGPNEWLIVIRDGKLVQSGIGLRTFVNPLTTTVATFPSGVKKVAFAAQQVSREMQGVEISGVVMWCVNREEDGPFRFFKNCGESQDADQNLRMVSESILRSTIANHNLSDIITQREMIRSEVKTKLMESVSGWGIWVETVELTDVKISSRALFEDLQTQFRQTTRLDAERVRLETERRIADDRMQSELKIAEARANTEKERALAESRAALAQEEEEALFFEKQSELAAQRLARDRDLKVREIESKREVEESKLASELKLSEKRAMTAAKKKVQEFEQKLKGEEEAAELFKRQLTTATIKSEHDAALAAKDMETRKVIEDANLKLELDLQSARFAEEIRQLEAKMMVESKTTEANFRKMKIDAARDVFKSLPIKNVNLTNYNGGGGEGGAWQVLGPFQEAMQAVASSGTNRG